MTVRRALARGLLLAGMALAAASPLPRTADAATLPSGIVVERASAWDDAFRRTTGWTGADGIYSVALDGRDAPGSAGTANTVFVFGDTFIGRVDAMGHRQAGTKLVRNTMAVMSRTGRDPGTLGFLWHTAADGSPQPMFVPSTPAAQPGDWYWLQDGLVIGRRLHWLALRMQLGNGGAFDFRVAGVALITIDLDSPSPLANVTQADAPLRFVPTDGRGEILLGAGIMANTAQAGAPAPDGYVYVYGHQNDAFNKKLVVARVLAEEFEDFAAWRFWDGTGWSADIETIAPLTDRVSSELSVTPLFPGMFVLVFQLDTLSRDVALRTAPGPTGPFGPVQRVWTCPEADADPDIYCYNAKAHPNLSAPGELLISYNVNTFDFGDEFTNADIYRPRFIRLRRP